MKAMKKSFIFLSLLVLAFSSWSRPAVEEKFIQLFQTNFPRAEKVSWEEYADCYAVNFTEGGIDARVMYARDESYVRLTRYYNEATMPYHVKHLVASRYSDKLVIGLNEVSNVTREGDVELNYYLIVEDEQKRMMIKMDARGNTEVVDKFKKKK